MPRSMRRESRELLAGIYLDGAAWQMRPLRALLPVAQASGMPFAVPPLFSRVFGRTLRVRFVRRCLEREEFGKVPLRTGIGPSVPIQWWGAG
jgi:hypothetical protein